MSRRCPKHRGWGLHLLLLVLLLPGLVEGQGLFGLRKREDGASTPRGPHPALPRTKGGTPPPAPPTGPPAPERDAPLPTGDAIVLDRADIMRTVDVGGRTVRELEGNVRVLHNGRVFTFGLGRYDQEAGMLTCTEKVKVVEGRRWLTADEVSYDERRETVSARGHVHSLGDSLEAWADKGHWYNGLKQGELQVQARVRDHGHKVELRAGNIEADHEKGIYTATRQPELTLLETPPTVLTARQIQWRSSDSLAMARRDVKLVREDFTATCDSLLWRDKTERMEFMLSPVLTRGERRIQGTRMTALLRDREELDSLWVDGDARMDSPSDSVSVRLRDVLQGRRMELDFLDGRLESVYVDGQARSVIFLKDEEGRPGMNVADAARMWLVLDDQRLRSVQMGGGMEARWVPLVAPLMAETPAVPATVPATVPAAPGSQGPTGP
jgi:lipopolysaccharide export system protein LptA